jgi:hypothetical protein
MMRTTIAEPKAMPNKKTNTKKPKQSTKSGSKGGSADFEMGSPKPVRKQKKKK